MDTRHKWDCACINDSVTPRILSKVGVHHRQQDNLVHKNLGVAGPFFKIARAQADLTERLIGWQFPLQFLGNRNAPVGILWGTNFVKR